MEELMRYIIGVGIGIILTLFYVDYMKTKQELYNTHSMVEACHLALFDEDTNWNVGALSICADLEEIKHKVQILEKQNKEYSDAK